MNDRKIHEPVVLVADIGGSKYMPGFVDGQGNILYQERREWDRVDSDSIVAQLRDALKDVCEKNPELARQAKSAGLTIPGFADPVSGVWVESDFLPVKDLPICEILTKEFGIPFFADNDCNACALAEHYFGGAKGLEDFLYMTISTGIGGALYMNSELYYGQFWHAGEIGMFVAEEDGRISDTGSMYGILEMHASGRGLAANYLEYGGAVMPDGKNPAGPEISRLAREKDPVALKTLDVEGRYLGRAIANACTMAHFRKVILGGGISLLFSQYEKALREELDRILPENSVAVEATQLGYSGAFLGAAAVALRGLEGFADAAQRKETELWVTVGQRVSAVLQSGNSSLNADGTAFGNFLVADGIEDPGTSLNRIAASQDWACLRKESGRDARAQETLECFGYAVGRAVAAACILLDPGKVVLCAAAAEDPGFRAGYLKAMKKHTYYRGVFPFGIEYQTHS